MTENPDGLFAWLSLNPATHVFTLARNAESLARLEELALLQEEDRSERHSATAIGLAATRTPPCRASPASRARSRPTWPSWAAASWASPPR